MPSLLYTGLSFWVRRYRTPLHPFALGHALALRSKRAISIPRWLSGDEGKIGTASKDTGNVNFISEVHEPDGSKSYADTSEEERQFMVEVEKQSRQLDEAAKQLKADIKTSRVPNSFPQDVVNRTFSPDERDRIAAALATLTEADFNEFPHHIKAVDSLPRPQRVILGRLNGMMDRASVDAQSSRIRKDLWRYYQRGKIYVPDLVKLMPDEGWKIIWLSQSEEVDTNPERSSHLRVLVDDMAKAGKVLTLEQQNARIEGLFMHGHPEKALDEWEAGLKNNHSGNSDFLELGIRMYAWRGNLARAEDLLDVLLKLHSSWDPAIAFPVITSFLNIDDDEASRRAYALYLRVRFRLGSNMTPEHYDAISLAFLQAGRKDLALAVFKDMVLCEDPTTEHAQAMQRILYDRFSEFLSIAKDVQQVNEVGLEALTFVPRHLQNAFFYAKWLKRLVESGEIEAATNVVELMYERGIQPNARHVNGIIVRWLSQSDRELHRRGEDLAWNMIQARLDFVRQRTMDQNPSKIPEKKSVFKTVEKAVSVPIYQSRPVPPANLDTFSILVKHYLKREMFENVRHLRNLLVDAQLKMSAPFMNALLTAELRYRTHHEVWTRFEIMSRSVTPNLETFKVLWECMKFHVDANTSQDPFGFPTPRRLFADMMTWLSKLFSFQLKEALNAIQPPLYEDILRCFLLNQDIEGCFVALHALRQIFDIYPEPSTFQMILVQATKLEITQGISRGQDSANDRDDVLTKYTQLLDLITSQRHDELRSENSPFEQLEFKLKIEENHRTILQFLSVMLQQKSPNDSTAYIGLVNKAAEEMKVENFDAEECMQLVV